MIDLTLEVLDVLELLLRSDLETKHQVIKTIIKIWKGVRHDDETHSEV